ncbi:MAG: GNAT family N-acetyltransferase [Candidatus Shapirobacteria bacterium]|nr:GNAT family N-acetyltransferase [Candidatus Shapirobacteria bacterium]
MTMIKIRPAKRSDLDFILKLTRGNMSWLIDWNDDLFLSNLKLENIFIALLEEEPVGLLDCEKKEDSLYIHNIQVKKSFWRQGIGSELMNRAFSLAKQLDCPKITLKVLKKNTGVINFYQKLGFSILANADSESVYLEKKLL